MNNADIEAARRLIAQFEGTALGRHNSNQWNRGHVDTPEQRRRVTLKARPEDCAVGDYCWSLGFNVHPDTPVARIIGPDRVTHWNGEFGRANYWEFERVKLTIRDQRLTRRQEAWHRIA